MPRKRTRACERLHFSHAPIVLKKSVLGRRPNFSASWMRAPDEDGGGTASPGVGATWGAPNRITRRSAVDSRRRLATTEFWLPPLWGLFQQNPPSADMMILARRIDKMAPRPRPLRGSNTQAAAGHLNRRRHQAVFRHPCARPVRRSQTRLGERGCCAAINRPPALVVSATFAHGLAAEQGRRELS